MSNLDVDISNNMRLEWLHSLSSFFKILAELWSMVVLEKKLATQASTYQVGHAPKILQHSLAHYRKDR
jgi:hypothetical protein